LAARLSFASLGLSDFLPGKDRILFSLSFVLKISPVPAHSLHGPLLEYLLRTVPLFGGEKARFAFLVPVPFFFFFRPPGFVFGLTLATHSKDILPFWYSSSYLVGSWRRLLVRLPYTFEPSSNPDWYRSSPLAGVFRGLRVQCASLTPA